MGCNFELYDWVTLAEGDLDLLQNLRKEMKREYEDEEDPQRFIHTKPILTDLSRRVWISWNKCNGQKYLLLWYLPYNSAVPKSDLIIWCNIEKASQPEPFGDRFGGEAFGSQALSPSSGGLRKTAVRPTRMGLSSLSSSQMSIIEMPKSCLGFAGGGARLGLSWEVPVLFQQASCATTLFLTLFQHESKEEVEWSLLAV